MRSREIPYPAKKKAFCEFLFFCSWQYFPVILLKDYGNHQAAASLLRDRYDRVSSRRRMMVIYVPKRPFSFLSFLSSSSSSVYSFLVSFPPCATLFTYFSQVFLSKTVKIKMTSEHFDPSLLGCKLTFGR